MATQLKADAWMQNVKVIDIQMGKVTYEYDNRTYDAKRGVVWYTLNNHPDIYPWQIRHDSNMDEIGKLEKGKTFRVFRKAIREGTLPGYDWAKVVSLEPKPKQAAQTSQIELDPLLFPTLEAALTSAMERVAEAPMTPEVRALLELLCVAMEDGRITIRG